jgi:hypothetical protein
MADSTRITARKRDSRDGEKARILLRAGGQTTPGLGGGAPQFGPDGVIFFSKQQENGIGSVVGVEVPRLNQRFDQDRREAAFLKEVF